MQKNPHEKILPQQEENPYAGNAEEIERAGRVCGSKEEALALAKKFWDALEFKHVKDKSPEWFSEPTAFGMDRTYVVRNEGNSSEWKVIFGGNGYPLSNRALRWLRENIDGLEFED